jgi:hypothetical protein
VKSVKAAADKLYIVLDAEQKAQADHVVLPMVDMGMGCGDGGQMMH